MNSQDSRPVRGLRRETAIRMIAWSVTAIAVVVILAGAKVASAVVAPTVLAGLIALTLTPLVAALERVGVPSSLSAATVVGSVVAAAGGGLYLLMPSLEEWRMRAPSVIRSIEWQLRDIEREIEESVGKAASAATEGGEGEKSATEAVMESGQKLFTDMLLATPEVLLGFLYVAILCFFVLAERATLRRLALSLCADWKTRLSLSRAFLDMRRSVSLYLLTVSIINAGLGAVAGVAFFLMGLPNPALWGAMVMVLNFMPYIGPVLANVIILAVGFTTFTSFTQALYPVLVLSALNMAEGQLVTPMVVGQRSRVGALSIFLAVALGAWLWGALGALVAAPSLIVAHRFSRRMILSRPLRSGSSWTHPPKPSPDRKLARLSPSIKAGEANVP